MKIPFGQSAFNRQFGNFPELVVVNMFTEEVQSDYSPSLLSRPAVTQLDSVGGGPITAIYQTNGVFNGDRFVVSGGSMYREGVSLGPVDGTGPAYIVGYADYLFYTAGANLWGYDGTSLFIVPFPDGAQVLAIAIGGSRLVAIRRDTQRFYWTEPLDTTIDPLSFASAENLPDLLLDLKFVGDTMWFFGAETVEPWPVSTESSDLPFRPMPGNVFPRGIRETGASVKVGTAFAWVTDLNQVCLNTPENIISFPGLEAHIRASASAQLWAYEIDGTEFIVLDLDTETWTYNLRSPGWAVNETHEETVWTPGCYARNTFGSRLNGALLVFDDAVFTDMDSSAFERRFRAGIALDEDVLKVGNLTLRCNTGWTPYASGPYANPVVEMRCSRDGGMSWEDWRQGFMGEVGRYDREVTWLGVGQFRFPGAIFEFRVTQPVPFRVSGVVVNKENT